MQKKISGLCGVCELKDAIYRCPKCILTYCSLSCYKGHKETCKITDKVPPTMEPSVEPPPLKFSEEERDEDVVKIDVLKKLGTSDHLHNMLSNKHLKDMLNEINTSSKPDKELERAMQIPIFTEFVDQCMSIVEPSQPDCLKITT